jgi:hypothetical protein
VQSEESEEAEETNNHSHHEIHNYVKIPKKIECLMISGIFILIIFIGNVFQEMKIVINILNIH